jgi:hypothetical protein
MDSVLANIHRALVGDAPQITMRVRSLGRDESGIVSGLEAMSKGNDSVLASIYAGADGRVRIGARKGGVFGYGTGVSQGTNSGIAGVTTFNTRSGDVSFLESDGSAYFWLRADTGTYLLGKIRASEIYQTKIFNLSDTVKYVEKLDSLNTYNSFAAARDSSAKQLKKRDSTYYVTPEYLRLRKFQWTIKNEPAYTIDSIDFVNGWGVSILRSGYLMNLTADTTAGKLATQAMLRDTAYSIRAAIGSGGGGSNPTKQSILDSLNATSPAVSTLTGNFNFLNNSNTVHADSIMIGTDSSNASLFVVQSAGRQGISSAAYGGTSIQSVRYAGGTEASPSAATTGTRLQFQYLSYDGTDFKPAITLSARILETWSSTAHGSMFLFSAVPIGSVSSNTYMNVSATGIGINMTSSPSAAWLHSQGTTEQLRLGYDASNYASFTVGSTGLLTFGGSGTNGGAIAGNTLLRDTSAFVTTGTRIAIYIAGATSTDNYTITARFLAETLPAAGDILGYNAKIDSLIVTRLSGVAGTNGLKFSWQRFK